MARVLWVAGSQGVADLMTGVLAAEGFEVVRACDGPKAVSVVHDAQPEIIVLETPLAGLDELELCRRLRGVSEAPIVLLADDAGEMAIVRALEAGADEYLAKPVRPRELAARLRALSRRAYPRQGSIDSGCLTLGELELNLDERRVHKRGQPVELSPIEFHLLTCLVREPGRVVSHRKIMARVWGPEYVDCRHYLRLYIRYLRTKLEDNPNDPKMILNEWGVGYRFEPGPPR